MEYGWPVFPEDDKCNIDNLPWLLFTCGVCCPLLVIPLCMLLIPAARIIDDIDVDGHVVRKQVDDNVVKEEVLTEVSYKEPISHSEKSK
ncbi:putative Pteridine transporter ft4putative [Leptomonas seymouri]|uniref:Putative Pteridine transporter ft4putative n=1 Tax=Leptomonas seymouri TaxID=5684 RepID=A0A0N1HSN9_LEPSE|nr:putative Pteridine transporter ft4putative [Leptomonas seymouri]|eukprot:KPI82545.1 putative Pteridine transporter ft4putative [Leptomonas seymouri]